MRKPNFFIIGHTRSSGTSLEINLMQHPDIFVISHKKGFFGFDTDLNSEQEYLKLFNNAKNEKYVGERCSDYIFCDTTASRLKQYCPYAKILLIIRNPVDVMYSLHSKMHLVETIENISDFETALNAESQRLKENILHPGTHPPQILYRTVVKYTEQISRYFEEFGKDNIKILIFDEITKNPEKIYKEIFEFLDVDSSFVPNFQAVNQNRNPRSQKLQSIVKKNQKLSNIFSKIPGSRMVYLNVNLPKSKRKSIDPKLRKKLQKELLPEVEELSKLVNKELTYWCK